MALGQNPAFTGGGITVVAASTTSAGVPLAGAGDTAVVTNTSAALAWVVFGGGSSAPVAVSGACTPVLPGAQRVVGCGALSTQMAVVLATGTGAVYVERGTGSAI